MTLSTTLLACSLWLASNDAFAPAIFTSESRVSSSLHVSVVSDFLKTNKASSNPAALKDVFERETPKSVGMEDEGIVQKKTEGRRRNHNKKRKHNFAKKETFLKAEPDLDFYTLHSSAVSHLQKDMPINDITRAMKRAQNLHDSHDLATIAAFLIDECDEHWGYGFRGSLLSRLAVAALHMNEVEIARRAIETRHVYERPSMQPYESAAIVRGLMRTGNVEEAWKVLDDELRLPMDGCALDSSDAQQKLKHRAKALSSIATRHFYQGEPYVAAKALFKLGELGFAIDESHMTDGELDMPWTKLVAAAETCHRTLAGNHVMKHPDSAVKLPKNLSELVWGAMLAFPCPGGQEECSVDEYLVTTTL